jgi:hypothetical protein
MGYKEKRFRNIRGINFELFFLYQENLFVWLSLFYMNKIFNHLQKIILFIDSSTMLEIDSTSTFLSCPKCRNDVEFDNIKTYQQHFTSVHLSKHTTDEYHW